MTSRSSNRVLGTILVGSVMHYVSELMQLPCDHQYFNFYLFLHLCYVLVQLSSKTAWDVSKSSVHRLLSIRWGKFLTSGSPTLYSPYQILSIFLLGIMCYLQHECIYLQWYSKFIKFGNFYTVFSSWSGRCLNPRLFILS